MKAISGKLNSRSGKQSLEESFRKSEAKRAVIFGDFSVAYEQERFRVRSVLRLSLSTDIGYDRRRKNEEKNGEEGKGAKTTEAK